jgi:hypothetical protein
MRAWIRNHRIAALFLGVLTFAGIGAIFVVCYFTYWFTLS